MKTSIKLVMTEITIYEPIKKEVEVIKASGKLTVKECKELLPEGKIYVNKEVVTEKFEVLTSELLKLKLKKGVVENEI